MILTIRQIFPRSKPILMEMERVTTDAMMHMEFPVS